MKYSQAFIDDLKARYRISEVIGRFIPVKRAGREYKALCPFHKEKSPSFTINDEKGFFHCFGCGAHGDVIGFTMDYERLSYPEAIEKLAIQAGVALPRESREEARREAKTLSLQAVVEEACSWFQSQLEGSAEGDLARRYIKERGLETATLENFRIGYAPADREALTRAMAAKNITQAQLIEAGLLIQVEDKAPYSRFRRRLMFPIRDRKSRVVAFGGRVLPGEPNSEAPKYLNSPETPLFHKGRMLFNLDRARRAALESRSLILAEGYMDVIVMAQAGMAQAVAPLGTAVTAEQLQLCWQLVDAPILCLDGDSAGQRAMARAMELALPLLVPGKTLSFATLPKGEDPDSLIRTHGVAALREILAAARPLAEMLWQQQMGQAVATPEAQAAQEATLLRRVGEIKHPSVQHYYKQFMHEKLREHSAASRRLPGSPASRQNFGRSRDKPGMTTFTPPPPIAPRSTDAALVMPVAKLIALVVTCPDLLQDAHAEEAWLASPLPSGALARLHQRITEAHIEYPALSATGLGAMLEEECREDLAVLKTALDVLGIARAADANERITLAQRLWREVVDDIQRLRLNADIAAAQRAYEENLSEENQQLVLDLRQQLEALERERTRYYREDDVSTRSTSKSQAN
ncbi:MAG: DNA primase [Alphaproteobacteria bacterium]